MSKEQPSVGVGSGAEEVVIDIDELLAGRVALEIVVELELVIMLEEFVTAKMVLEAELELELELKVELEVELVKTTDDSVKDTETLELDVLLRLEIVEIAEEFEIGYRTLLEPDLLLDTEMEVEILGPEIDALPLTVVVLGLDVTSDLVTGGDFVEGEELTVLEKNEAVEELEVPALDGTIGLKMTMAKISPGAILELLASNWTRGRHRELLSSRVRATQSCSAAHCERQAYRSTEIPGKLPA